MNDRAAFLAAIIVEPDDDLPRLVYADWLDEHGEPERAEFIRVQCRITAMEREYDPQSLLPDSHPAHAEYRALRRRDWELLLHCNEEGYTLSDREASWLPGPLLAIIREQDGRRVVHRSWQWRRGFVAEVELPADDFARHGEALLLAAPVEVLRLTGGRPGLWTHDNTIWRYSGRGGDHFTIRIDTPPVGLHIGRVAVEVKGARAEHYAREVTGFGDAFRRPVAEPHLTVTLGRRLPSPAPLKLDARRLFLNVPVPPALLG
jgi:uncharacterized protein (TIGR02996 family)